LAKGVAAQRWPHPFPRDDGAAGGNPVASGATRLPHHPRERHLKHAPESRRPPGVEDYLQVQPSLSAL